MLEVLLADECAQKRAARYTTREAATVPAALPAVQPSAALPAVQATAAIVSTDSTFLPFSSTERRLTKREHGILSALASQNPAASFRVLPTYGDYLLYVEKDVCIPLGAGEWLTDPVMNARLGLLQYHLRYVVGDSKTLILSTYLWV